MLDAPARRPEQRGDGEGRDGDGEVGAARERGEDLLQEQHDPEVEAGQADGDDAVDERPADDHVES